MISYNPLLNYLTDNKIPLGYLKEELNISTTVVAKFKKGEYVHMEIIDRICQHFNIPIERVIRVIPKSEY